MTTTRVETENPADMIRTERHGDVLLAVMDMPGRTMNVFSWGMMDALEALLEQVEQSPEIKAVVLTSGKDTFLAGADLEMVRGFTIGANKADYQDLVVRTGRLGRLFVRLEAIPKPFVAAINGLALGGGLEVTMACHYRVVADDPRLQLGLPEIKLGLLAGAGGTQRLPRLIGIEKGMEYLLNGKSLAPAEALALGLVDEVVSAAELLPRALAIATEKAGKPVTPRFKTSVERGPFDFTAPDAIRRITRHYGHSDDVTARYPAYDLIVRCVIEGADMPIREADHNEILRFVDLIRNPVAGNMVGTLFLNRQKADKLPYQPGLPKGARFAVAGEGAATETLKAALTVARATLVAPGEATGQDIVIGHSGDGLVLLSAPDQARGAGTGLVIRRSKDYGTALEILSNGNETLERKALALARQLRATPFIHAGQRSLLLTLEASASGASEEVRLAAQAAAAEAWRIHENVQDTEQADVISVVGGGFPAYTGGPFTYLRQVKNNA